MKKFIGFWHILMDSFQDFGDESNTNYTVNITVFTTVFLALLLFHKNVIKKTIHRITLNPLQVLIRISRNSQLPFFLYGIISDSIQRNII